MQRRVTPRFAEEVEVAHCAAAPGAFDGGHGRFNDLCVDVGAVVEEELHHVFFSGLGCVVEDGVAVAVAGLDFGTLGEHECDDRDVAPCCGEVEGCVSAAGVRVDVGTGVDEETGNVVVVVFQGAEEGCVFVVVFDVDVVAEGEEGGDEMDVAVFGGEVERGFSEAAVLNDDIGGGGKDVGEGVGGVELAGVAVVEEG